MYFGPLLLVLGGKVYNDTHLFFYTGK